MKETDLYWRGYKDIPHIHRGLCFSDCIVIKEISRWDNSFFHIGNYHTDKNIKYFDIETMEDYSSERIEWNEKNIIGWMYLEHFMEAVNSVIRAEY